MPEIKDYNPGIPKEAREMMDVKVPLEKARPVLKGPDLSDLMPKPVSEMTFLGGRLCLRDAHRLRKYHIKSPERVLEFLEHQLAIARSDVAEGLLSDRVNFQARHGFFVEEECLPPDVLRVWSGLHRENQRAVAIALARGARTADALALVSQELQEIKGRESKVTTGVADEFTCVYCGVQFKGKHANIAKAAHEKALHSEEMRAAG
jgi:hypothetical protein